MHALNHAMIAFQRKGASMGYIIGFLSQKGGVGKSTLARTLACEVAANGETVKIADLDIQQGTSFEWMGRRAQAAIEPSIQVQTFAKVKDAIDEAGRFYVYVVDGAPHASKDTQEVAKVADLIVFPVGASLDDLNPSIRLAHELVKSHNIDRGRIAFALIRVPDNEAEVDRARNYITDSGYRVASGSIPHRTAFSQAMDQGKALSEVPHPTLRARVDDVVQIPHRHAER